jgi:hypothetical protein
MVVDGLFHDDEQYLSLEAVIARIALNFECVEIRRPPTPLPQAEKHAIALISVSDNQNSDEWLSFYFKPGREILIDYESPNTRERLRKSGLKLAELLGYSLDRCLVGLKAVIGRFDIAEESKWALQIQDAVGQSPYLQDLGFESDFMGLIVSVSVEDTEVGIGILQGILDGLFPADWGSIEVDK